MKIQTFSSMWNLRRGHTVARWFHKGDHQLSLSLSFAADHGWSCCQALSQCPLLYPTSFLPSFWPITQCVHILALGTDFIITSCTLYVSAPGPLISVGCKDLE